VAGVDRITLTGLRAHGHHGVFEFERREGQEFVVDAALVVDLSRAAATDDVTDTVHYGELASRLVAVISGEPVNLIETLAARLLEVCLEDRRVTEATITVHKPRAPIPHPFSDVSVTLHRRSSDTAARAKT
jgi:7,8-dihydroneopterin aldolase/epimerase/oxygenase